MGASDRFTAYSLAIRRDDPGHIILAGTGLSTGGEAEDAGQWHPMIAVHEVGAWSTAWLPPSPVPPVTGDAGVVDSPGFVDVAFHGDEVHVMYETTREPGLGIINNNEPVPNDRFIVHAVRDRNGDWTRNEVIQQGTLVRQSMLVAHDGLLLAQWWLGDGSVLVRWDGESWQPVAYGPVCFRGTPMSNGTTLYISCDWEWFAFPEGRSTQLLAWSPGTQRLEPHASFSCSTGEARPTGDAITFLGWGCSRNSRWTVQGDNMTPEGDPFEQLTQLHDWSDPGLGTLHQYMQDHNDHHIAFVEGARFRDVVIGYGEHREFLTVFDPQWNLTQWFLLGASELDEGVDPELEGFIDYLMLQAGDDVLVVRTPGPFSSTGVMWMGTT